MKFRGTCLFIFLALASNAYAQTAPNLQTAGNFALLGGAAVSNASAGTTIKGGNVGSTTITGPFLSGVNLIGAPLPITVGAGPF